VVVHPLHRRLLGGVLALGVLGSPAVVAASEPALRAAVVPGTAGDVAVHRRVVLGAAAQLRWVAADPTGQAQRVGAFLHGGAKFLLHPVITLDVGYGWGFGQFPLEGAADREHRGALGLRVASRGTRVRVSNRARLDLRGLRLAGDWSLHPRPRNETALTFIAHRWAQFTLAFEALLQPTAGIVDMLQLRSGLAIHGDGPVGRQPRDRRRERSMLAWFVGLQAGVSPLALAWSSRRGAAEVRALAPSAAAAGRGAVDLVLSVGLSAMF
jgi:hypothetical protein